MKSTLLATCAGVALALLPTIAAAGEKVDMAELTCQQFLADQDGIMPTVFWIDGYLSHSSGNTVLDPDELVANIKNMAETCANEPDTKIIDLLEE